MTREGTLCPEGRANGGWFIFPLRKILWGEDPSEFLPEALSNGTIHYFHHSRDNHSPVVFSCLFLVWVLDILARAQVLHGRVCIYVHTNVGRITTLHQRSLFAPFSVRHDRCLGSWKISKQLLTQRLFSSANLLRWMAGGTMEEEAQLSCACSFLWQPALCILVWIPWNNKGCWCCQQNIKLGLLMQSMPLRYFRSYLSVNVQQISPWHQFQRFTFFVPLLLSHFSLGKAPNRDLDNDQSRTDYYCY